jgi:hypothetical protein
MYYVDYGNCRNWGFADSYTVLPEPLKPEIPESESAESSEPGSNVIPFYTAETTGPELVMHRYELKSGIVVGREGKRVSVLLIPDLPSEPDTLETWYSHEIMPVTYADGTSEERMHMIPWEMFLHESTMSAVISRVRLANDLRSGFIPLICLHTGRQFFPVPSRYEWGLEINYNPRNLLALENYFRALPVELCWHNGRTAPQVLAFGVCGCGISADEVRAGVLKGYVYRFTDYPVGRDDTAENTERRAA